ncbi:MAG: hypothetical protein NC252_10240 [Roseburia sp.]|nr:hypothetical protein [Roseburia sp.]
MVYIGRKSPIAIRTTLIGIDDKFPVIYLELHKTEARSLTAFRISCSEK